MATSAPKSAIDEIEEWSEKLSPWKRDALRRAAISPEFTSADIDELMAMLKVASGFQGIVALPAVPFEKAHFGAATSGTLTLKGISNVSNVNRLMPKASLTFDPKSLSIVYGRNGSGKSGFVRILRTACRTRVEKQEKLKILADVYGSSTGPQTADILLDTGTGDVIIPWETGKQALPELAQVAVFDTASAQLYVDGGNQIRFLPFGLALPHRLNAVCLTLKGILDAERTTAVGAKIGLCEIHFPSQRETKAQKFNTSLEKTTTNEQIDLATPFGAEDDARLDSITAALSAGLTAVSDLNAILKWVETIHHELPKIEGALNDVALTEASKLHGDAISARKAAVEAAALMFSDEPLTGVGSDTWRALWLAAREYSISEAYPLQEYPVLALKGGAAACVLCQQPLLEEGAARMQRFQKHMENALDITAKHAESAVANALAAQQEFASLSASDFLVRLEQITNRKPELAESLKALHASVLLRKTSKAERLKSGNIADVPALVVPLIETQNFLESLKQEKQTLEQASNGEERAKLVIEKAELEDRKLLASNKSRLLARRDLKVLDHCYATALADLQTKGITQRANELVDAHLTTAVASHFDLERANFDITHLKIGLSRKSSQTKAEFDVNPQTTLTKVPSEILSEGEQRALALAGFLTEVALTENSGPIVIDDPVSSLDRDRSIRVAKRLAKEACHRQVIVFTHDITFFNELCQAAEEVAVEPATIAIFSDGSAAGKVDQAGMVWKGLNVSKRLARIKNDANSLPKLHASSPADYEYQIKNLYGRLRDTYERVIEEVIFSDIVRRGTDVIQTLRLRYVTLSDALAIRFHQGMTRANTHSHDNPAADTVAVPTPSDFDQHILDLESLVGDLKAESKAAEAARPQMKP